MIIASPQEPEEVRNALKNLCIVKIHAAPELIGADYTFQGVWEGKPIRVGVQRKTQADLIASYASRRLNSELTRLSRMDIGIVLIEGCEKWNADGTHPYRAGWTLDGFRNALVTIQMQRFIVTTTRDHEDTARRLCSLEKYYMKKLHSSILGGANHRPKDISPEVNFLQGIPHCGQVRATKIFARFKMPMRWVISKQDLIDELGPKVGADIYNFLGGNKNGR